MQKSICMNVLQLVAGARDQVCCPDKSRTMTIQNNDYPEQRLSRTTTIQNNDYPEQRLSRTTTIQNNDYPEQNDYKPTLF